MTNTLNRKDNRYLDFEDVTVGTVILVDVTHDHNVWDLNDTMPHVHFEKGDIWVVEALANRPRVAVVRNLQRGTRSGIRVDELLELDDKDILTLGPG